MVRNDKRQIVVRHKRAPKPIRFKAKEKGKPKLGKAVKERMFHWNNQKKPKRGDLIEIFRPVCQHWGIYVGNGNVIHLLIKSKVQGILPFIPKNAVVEMEPLRKVVGNNKYQINNKYDIRFLPRPREEIIVRAIAKVGKVTDYSIFTQNCEHFVTKLRYGKAVSAQVTDAVAAAKGVVAAVAVPIAKVILGPVFLLYQLWRERWLDEHEWHSHQKTKRSFW